MPSEPKLLSALVEDILNQHKTTAQEVESISELLQSIADPVYAKGSSIYVPGTPFTIGVRVPLLQEIVKPLIKLAKKNPEKGFEFARAFWKKNTREQKVISAFIMKGLTRSDIEGSWKLLEELLPDLTDWEIVDQLSGCISPMLFADHDRTIKQAEKWLTNSNTWIRRLGMVIVVSLCRDKKMKDWERLANHLDKARGETHPTQLKALGWCWRSITPHAPHIVYVHLLKWAGSSHRGDLTVAWSGSEKLDTEQRAELRRRIDESRDRLKNHY